MKILSCSATLFALFVFAVSVNTLPAVLLRASGELNISSTSLSVAGSVQFLGFFFATLLGGALSDRVGKKGILVVATLLMGLGAGVVVAAQSGLHVAIGCALLGMGGGVVETLSSAILVELFPTRRKLMLNLSQVIFCVGAVGAPLAMGWLLPRGVSWRLSFAGVAALCAVLLVLLAKARFPHTAPHADLQAPRLSVLVRRPSVVFPCVALFAYVFSEFAVIMFANYYLSEHLAAPESWSIYAIAWVWCAVGLGRLGCAAIPEGHSYEKLLSTLMVVSALLMGAQVWVTDWHVALLLFTLTGISFSGVWPMIVGMAASRSSARSTATVLGLTISVGALGCASSPPVLQWLFAHLDPAWVFPVAGLPLLVGAVAVHIGKTLSTTVVSPGDAKRP
jgi:fucose permease